MSNKIQSAPNITLDIDDKGLKNLAGWLARYAKFGVLNIEEHSSFVCGALNSGSFIQFEPILEKCVSKGYYHWGADDEYEKYEFSVCLEILKGDEAWMNLCFQFKSDDRAKMYIVDHADNPKLISRLDNVTKTFSEALGIAFEKKEMTWLEADEIILGYLRYIHALTIQTPPATE